MPTIFERITSGMQDNNLTAALAGQVGKISGAGGQLSSLAHGRLPALDSLKTGLLNVAPPKIDLGSLSSSLTSLTSAIPTDTSSVTGGISQALGGLDAGVSSNIAGQVEKVADAITALQTLFKNGFAPLPFPPRKPARRSGTQAATSSPRAAGGGAGAGPAPAAAGAPGAGGAAASGPAEDARQRRLAAVKAIDQTLATVQPFTASSFIVFVQKLVAEIPRGDLGIHKVPILDDFIDLFGTVVALQTLDAVSLLTYIEATVQKLAALFKESGSQPLTAIAGRLNGLSAKVDTAHWKTEMDALTTAMARIGAATAGDDLSGSAADLAAANGALNTLLPRLASLNADLFSGQVDAAQRALERLPIDTERSVRRVVAATAPVSQVALLTAIGDKLSQEIERISPEDLGNDVDELLKPLVKALDIVNVIPIREPILTAIDAIKTAADGVDQLLGQAASQTGLLFDQLNRLLAQVDTSAVTTAIQQAISDFQATLQQQANTLFEPVRTAIASGVATISDAVSGFDAEEIVNELKDAIAKLAGVLNAPDVKSAVDAINQAVNTATEQLQNISFEPLTSQVIAGIDDITAALKAIDPNQLSVEVKVALKAAVAILPGDLKPVTDPLVTEFDHLVDTGPKPLLITIEAQPAKLLEQVKNFSPARLIGNELGKPFEDLIAQLEQFKPSSLLAPVTQALNGLKDQLRKKADPGQLLEPLETLFNQILAQFDKLKPDVLMKPLNDAVKAVIDKVLAALPLDDLLHAFAEVLAPFQEARDMAESVKNVLDKATGLVDGLADPETQIRAWLQPLFDHIDQMPGISAMQPAFDALTAAVDALKADSMRAALEAALAPLRNGLAALNPQQALARMSAAYASVSPTALASLPASAQNSAAQALLARFNPVAADFSRPFDGCDRWLKEIQRDQTAFETLLAHWDLRYHASNRPLDGFSHPAITAADVKAILHESLENEIVQPLAHLLKIVQSGASAAKPPLTKVSAFIEAFEQKIDDVLLGPNAFGGIRDALNLLVTRLHGINLQFLITQMDTTFQAVRGKLTAVSPTALRALVEQAFNDAINLLDISQLLPQDQITAIDGDYQKIIDQLKQFDPKKLIIDVVQPEFDNTITPLLAAFDVTTLLQATVDRLDALKTELQQELDKTNQSYQAMLAAVPSISLADAAGAVAGAVGDIAGGFGF